MQFMIERSKLYKTRAYAAGGLGLWQSGTCHFSFVVFTLYERKNDKHMIGTYHAVASENAALCCGMQQLRKS